jgi:Gas vesicle protein G
MGLLTELLLVPFAPARIALWSVGELIESAAREAVDPAAIRRELAELSRRLDEGLEDQILERLESRIMTSSRCH